jgi:flagellar basal-body rod protein FlgF
MDKGLFLTTTGAGNAMRQLELTTNNLANVSTTGFRADYGVMGSSPVKGSADPARAYSVMNRTYSDFRTGPIVHTDRELDVAVSGQGFIAVQSKSGKEGYTRAGEFRIVNGVLTTPNGDLVLGEGGTINMGSAERFSIGTDGTISAKFTGAQEFVPINRIKLVKPDVHQLEKGDDGLFYTAKGTEGASRDNSVKLMPGALEGSNVNPVEALTSLIELSRQFDMDTNMMKTMDTVASKANEILDLPR